MANIHTGEVRRWDSLTDEQQKSGEWIKVPDGTEGGGARPKSMLDDMFPAPGADAADEKLKRHLGALTNQRGGFDAVGKPRK